MSEQIFIIIWRLNASVRPDCVHIECAGLFPLGPGPAWYFCLANVTVSLEVGRWCKPVSISVPYCSVHARATPRSPATSCPHTLPCFFLQLGTLRSRADSPPTPSPACCLLLQMSLRTQATSVASLSLSFFLIFFFCASVARASDPRGTYSSCNITAPHLSRSRCFWQLPPLTYFFFFFFSQKDSNCCYYVLQITENGWRRRRKHFGRMFNVLATFGRRKSRGEPTRLYMSGHRRLHYRPII